MSIEELKRENAELKAANLELKSRIKLMQTIFDNLSEGVVATSLEGEFLLANPVAQEISGVGPTEGSPEEWSETYGTFYSDAVTLVPSNELPLFKAMQGEATNNVKLFIRNQNKPEGVFFSVSGRPLLDETGNLIGGVIAMRDITELERVTEQLQTTVQNLQNQNALMNAIFNSIGDGIVVISKEGRYTLFNEKAEEMLGQILDGMSTTEAPEKLGLFQPDGQKLFSADELPLDRALRDEVSDNIEILIRNAQLPHGLDASISARPIYDKNGTVNGGVAVIRDVTELKTSERQLVIMNDQLISQTQLLQSIFDSISDGVLVANETGDIIMTNRSGVRIMNESGSTILFRNWTKEYRVFHTDGITPFPIEELPLLKAIRGESVDNVEVFVKSKKLPDGIYINLSGRPLRDAGVDQIGGVVVFHDITDKIKREEALARAFAQGRLEIVDTILHNIGNAINSVSVGIDTIYHQLANDKLTPRLTALANAIEPHQDNFSDYIKNDPQGQKVFPFILSLSEDFNVVKQQWTKTVQRIRNRTRHIVDIIRTQNSYNIVGGTHKDVKLTDAISDAVKMFQDSIEKRQIHIEIDCKDAPEDIRIQES